LPSRIAADKPPNPAPMMTMRGREEPADGPSRRAIPGCSITPSMAVRQFRSVIEWPTAPAASSFRGQWLVVIAGLRKRIFDDRAY
jgi:hypothetical protein